MQFWSFSEEEGSEAPVGPAESTPAKTGEEEEQTTAAPEEEKTPAGEETGEGKTTSETEGETKTPEGEKPLEEVDPKEDAAENLRECRPHSTIS